MEGCKGGVVHSNWGEQDVLQWWSCSSRSWGDHWQHFPFEAAWHFFPCLFAENLRFEVQFGHVEIGIVCSIFPYILGWYSWSGRNVYIVTGIARQLCFQRGVPNYWWWFQCMYWTCFKKWWCWLGWMLRLWWAQCSGHVARTMGHAKWTLHCQQAKTNPPDWRQLDLQAFKWRNFDSNRFHSFGPANSFWQYLEWLRHTDRFGSSLCALHFSFQYLACCTESKITKNEKLGTHLGWRWTSGQISSWNTTEVFYLKGALQWVRTNFVEGWDTWWQMFPDFFGISGFRWTSKAPIAKAFGTRLRGTSDVIIADSDITSRRDSCMEIIKIGGVIEEFGKMERNFPTSCNSGPASSGATSSKWICKYVGSWNKFLVAVPTKWWQLPPCFQRTIGIRMNCWWQSNDWRLTNLLMKKGLLQSCYILLLTISSTAFWDFSMAWCILRKCLLTGAKLFSICCQNMVVRRFLLSIGPLQASAFCTRRLLIWFWVVWSLSWKLPSPKNNMDFDPDSIWWQQIW